MVVSCKFPFGKIGFKCFIGHQNDNGKLMLFSIMLPRISAFGRNFDETKCMSFLTKHNELAQIHNEIWDKVSNTIKHLFTMKKI